jgi:hypothetical protein
MVGSASLVASTLERWREEATGYLAEHRPDIPIDGMSDGWLDINVQDVARKRGDKYPPRRPASGQGNVAHVTRLHDSPGIDSSRDNDPIPRRTQTAPSKPAPTDIIRLRFFSELTQPAPKPWLIKNVIAKGETSSWIAPPGKGKSGLLTDIAVHLAAGPGLAGLSHQRPPWRRLFRPGTRSSG